MAAKKAEVVKITPIKEKEAIVRIKGTSPLIVHKWSEKAKRMLPAGKRAYSDAGITVEKEYASPVEQFMTSMYWMTEMPTEYTEEAFEEAVKNGARWGFRVESIKAAAIDAAYSKKWIPNKKSVQGVFFIEPDMRDAEGYQLVEIKGCVPEMREDTVVLSGIGRTPDLRWRAQFVDWFADLRVSYDATSQYSLQDICNMINLGGRYNGIGEYRPEKGGSFGMFKVDTK